MEEELEKWLLVEDIVEDDNEEPLQVEAEAEEPQDLLGKLIVRTQHTRPSNAPSASSLMKRGGATGQTLAAEFISAAGA
jgi:hypothetical protein